MRWQYLLPCCVISFFWGYSYGSWKTVQPVAVLREEKPLAAEEKVFAPVPVEVPVEVPDVEENAVQPPRHAIKHISIVAERHTGSKALTNMLSQYFATAGVSVEPRLCNWKHWFQDRLRPEALNGTLSCRAQPCDYCKQPQDTLVLALWRNPYDWLSAMFSLPHHSISHRGVLFSDFLNRSWTLDPQANDWSSTIAKQAAAAPASAPCMDNFRRGEVVPCLKDEREAIYEMDPQGRPYANVYAMRVAKIADFNAIATWAPHYQVVNYESLLANGKKELESWLASVAKTIGVSVKRKPQISASQLAKLRSSFADSFYLQHRCNPKARACLFGQSRKALTALHALWDDAAEASIGYERIEPSALPKFPENEPEMPRNSFPEKPGAAGKARRPARRRFSPLKVNAR